MRHFALNFVVFLAYLSCVGAATAQTHCQYGGELFSNGSTICECPNLKMEAGYGAEGGAQISSRRLACGEDGFWKNDNSFCVDISYMKNTWTPAQAQDDFIKYTNLYCPRVPVNHAEIEKAITQDTEKFFDKAPKTAAQIAVHAICSRYKIDALCASMIDALAAKSDDTGAR
jgi:hypothetical protein